MWIVLNGCKIEGPEKRRRERHSARGNGASPGFRALVVVLDCLVIGSGAYRASGKAVPDEAQFYSALMKLGAEYLCAATCAGDWRASIRGEKDGLTLSVMGGEKTQPRCDEALAVVTWGKDPIELVKQTMALVAKRMGTFRLCEEKREPAFTKYLGWCIGMLFTRSIS